MKRALLAIALVGLALLLWSIWNREALLEWIRSARALPFFAVMALLPAVGVPITPFFVLAGASFGIRVGLIGSLLALGANFALCYFIARSSLRPRLVALLRRFDYELPNFAAGGKSALRFALVVKATPGVPAFVKNYALGAANVPFGVYLATSMSVTGLYAALLIVLGESLFDHDLRKTLLVGGALLSCAGAFLWMRNRRGRGGAQSSHRPVERRA
jgi:uncharacterized membrane protein YdjX (TVP38/TMEM64 family)